MTVETDSQFHVLAVDDSLIDRKLIERLLKHSSYQVTTVESGSKALALLGLSEDDQSGVSPSSSSPDQQEIGVNLIITDYCMPGMTGYDLLKRIKGSSTWRDIPVVIMSSENVPSRINRCLEDGAEEFFLKPVQLSDMKRLRSYLLKGKQKDSSQQQAQPQIVSQQQQQQQHLQKQEETFGNSDKISSICNKRKVTMDQELSSPERRKQKLSSSSNLAVET